MSSSPRPAASSREPSRSLVKFSKKQLVSDNFIGRNGQELTSPRKRETSSLGEPSAGEIALRAKNYLPKISDVLTHLAWIFEEAA